MQSRDRGLDKEIGARIREIRIKAGVSQVALGRILDRKQPASSMHKYEKGENGLNPNDLKKIAEHFKVSLDLIIRGVEPKGLDPTLTQAEIDTILQQFGATPIERSVFEKHQRMYASARITSAYLVAFLLGHRSHGDVEKAVDEATSAVARDAAIAESGSAERVEPGALRKRRSKRK